MTRFLLGGTDTEFAPGDLPDIALTRSVARPVEDAAGDLPVLTRAAAWIAPDHGPLVGFRSVQLTGTVRVAREAVVTALDGQHVTAESAEEAFLSVARPLAAQVTGGARPEPPVDLDVSTAIEDVEVTGAETVAVATFAAGLGVAGKALVSADVAVGANVQIEVRAPADPERLREAGA